MKKEQNLENSTEQALTIPVVSGSFVTVDNCLSLGFNIEGMKFITEDGQIKTAKKFVFSDSGTPYLYWDEYEAGCLIPAINLRMRTGMKWL